MKAAQSIWSHRSHKQQVNVQQLSRDPDTGECILKITPINGDKVLYELGGEQPSSASGDVADAMVAMPASPPGI